MLTKWNDVQLRMRQLLAYLCIACAILFPVYDSYAEGAFLDPLIQMPELSSQEHSFLETKINIRLCVNAADMPLQGLNSNGSVIGILADLNQLIARKINKQIITVRFNQQDKQLCDAYFTVDFFKQNKSLRITEPVFQESISMAIANNQTAIYQLKYLVDKRFAINKNATFFNSLLDKYPQIQFLPVLNAKTGLAMVSSGLVYGYIDSLATLIYQAKDMGIIGIKIADFLDHKRNSYYVLKQNQILLLGILNKAILSITAAERNNVVSSWVAINYQQKMVKNRFALWGGGLFLVLSQVYLIWFLKKRCQQKKWAVKALSLENEQLKRDVAKKNHAQKQSIRFAEMFSHEYRTPVSIITTNLDILELKNNQSDLFIESQIEKMRDAASKLIVLVETALDRESLATTNLVAAKDKFDFYLLMDEVDKEMKNNYPTRKLRITMSHQPCVFYGDKKLLKIMLNNLIENAFKYSNVNLPVLVSLNAEGERLSIRVIDKGVGIPLADIKHVFDKYHRASNTSNASGIGIGLYLTKLIITQHQGDISVVCPPEGGTQIKIELPL